MTKKLKLYTKTGDDGTTGLVGGGRVKKYDLRLEAYGTVDELNAAIGLIRSNELSEEIIKLLINIQNKLFNIGSRLASDEKGNEFTIDLSITQEHIEELEKVIDKFDDQLPKIRHFVLPGSEIVSSQCHVARTICRRAERRILEYAEKNTVQKEIIVYINRLSDFLFVLARKIAFDKNSNEVKWEKD